MPANTNLRTVCRLLLAGFLFISAASVQCQPSQDAAKPFVMAADGESTTFGSRWVLLIYTEAFKRLGIPFRLDNYPLARREALVQEGVVDGETSRVYSYGDSHPKLLRVEESLIDLSFSLYTTNPALHLAQLQDLRATNYRVEYRRGILICENTLKRVVPSERISDVSTQNQGLLKLLAGRTDLYCDIDVYVLQELQSAEFKDAKVRKVIDIGEAVPTYPYLHKKHADLAPRLAAVLKQMKSEGLIKAYRLQVERDLGWRN
jgi:polar amino acid transport system substrate-binding protein